MLKIDQTQLAAIKQHVAGTYPYEGGGLLIGRVDEHGAKVVDEVKVFANQREIEEQHHRILIADRMVREAEDYADNKGALLIGFFHSHPDHPARPSEFDRDHALPWWSYLIVSVLQGRVTEVLSWELRDDRSQFDEEPVTLIQTERETA
jgi:proteasome lid subunit RPN8/RPN11